MLNGGDAVDIPPAPEVGRNASGPSHRRRLAWASLAGAVVAGGLAVMGVDWQLIPVAGWCSTSATLLASTWPSLISLDATDTARKANEEDETRAQAGLIVVVASGMSLIGVGLGLHRASTVGGIRAAVLTVVSVLAVALSWVLVQMVFTLRYAHEYYEADGGVDFGSEPPAYADFAYLAFTIGMTYQVSDTPITVRSIRRTATRHALLSFLFGTSIVAVTINVVAGLVS